jgi:hypothetical protein
VTWLLAGHWNITLKLQNSEFVFVFFQFTKQKNKKAQMKGGENYLTALVGWYS